MHLVFSLAIYWDLVLHLTPLLQIPRFDTDCIGMNSAFSIPSCAIAPQYCVASSCCFDLRSFFKCSMQVIPGLYGKCGRFCELVTQLVWRESRSKDKCFPYFSVWVLRLEATDKLACSVVRWTIILTTKQVSLKTIWSSVVA